MAARRLQAGTLPSILLLALQQVARPASMVIMGPVAQAVWQVPRRATKPTMVESARLAKAVLSAAAAAGPPAQVGPAIPLLPRPEHPLKQEVGREAMVVIMLTGAPLLLVRAAEAVAAGTLMVQRAGEPATLGKSAFHTSLQRLRLSLRRAVLRGRRRLVSLRLPLKPGVAVVVVELIRHLPLEVPAAVAVAHTLCYRVSRSPPATPTPTLLALVAARPMRVGPVLSMALPASQPAVRVAPALIMGRVAQAAQQPHQQVMSSTMVGVVQLVYQVLMAAAAAGPPAQVALAIPLVVQPEQAL